MKKILTMLLLLCLVCSVSPMASAYSAGDPWRPDLKAFLQDPQYRDYVETTVDYHLRTNSDIRNALDQLET